MKRFFARTAIVVAAALVLPVLSLFGGFSALAVGTAAVADKCPSGKMTVKLTGWSLNGKTPRGNATFEEANKTLKVTVEAIGLDDGTPLDIFLDDKKLGETKELKSGEVVAAFTVDSLPDAQDVLSVNNDDRPLVTGSMKCIEKTATNAD